MTKIKGITVKLLSKFQTGVDQFNRPIFEEKKVEIDNVLVSPLSTKEVIDVLNLMGKKATYNLAIPKEDNHEWEGQRVEFFNEVWEVVGIPLLGIEKNIPLCWNKKVMVERYDKQSSSETE